MCHNYSFSLPPSFLKIYFLLKLFDPFPHSNSFRNFIKNSCKPLVCAGPWLVSLYQNYKKKWKGGAQGIIFTRLSLFISGVWIVCRFVDYARLRQEDEYWEVNTARCVALASQPHIISVSTPFLGPHRNILCSILRKNVFNCSTFFPDIITWR